MDVEFYDGPHELQTRLETIVDDVIGRENGEKAHEAFTRSLGAQGPTGERAETWQILSPTRERAAGTIELNRQIQQRYKRGLLDPAPGRKKRSTFGDEDIVWTDKVIQIRNCGRPAWPSKTGADYVANGEIGVVHGTDRDGGWLNVAFSTQRDVEYRYWGSDDVNDQLRLAYAVTVHKAQGSDFDTVILVLPTGTPILSRELLYTALTRFRKRMILLLERDVSALREFRRPERSSVVLRNSNLFEPQLRPADGRLFPHRLIHQAENGTLVRSKSELVVLETLLRMGLSVQYERQLDPRGGGSDFRLPDFTVSYEGDVYYWEHLGMLDLTSYSRKWKRKLAWYRENGYIDRLITSAEGEGAGLSVPVIKERAERRIQAGKRRGPDEPGFD